MDPNQVEVVARRHGIRLLLRFGSSVTGLLHQASDVDLGVILDRVPDSFGALADCLTDLQALVPDREVDLVVLNHADPLLLKQVTDHCVLVYGSPRELQALKLYAFKRYQDHRRYLDMEREYVDRKIAAMTS
jgi:uncharacterized protein